MESCVKVMLIPDGEQLYQEALAFIGVYCDSVIKSHYPKMLPTMASKHADVNYQFWLIGDLNERLISAYSTGVKYLLIYSKKPELVKKELKSFLSNLENDVVIKLLSDLNDLSDLLK